MNRSRGACKLCLGLLLLVTSLFFAASAKADPSSSVELELDRPSIALGDQGTLKVIVGGKGAFSNPVLPDVEGLDVIYQGRAQSVQIINMQVTTSKIYTYAVLPRREGDFTIGPAQVKLNGQILKSNTVQLSVNKEGRGQSPQASEQRLILDASVDNANPYIGQQITLIFRFGRAAEVPIRKAGYEMPSFPDFWSEGTESRREYVQRIDGRDYKFTEIAIPLFPITAGEIAIGSITVRYEEIVPSDGSRNDPFRDPFGRSFFDDDFFKFFRQENVVKRTAYTQPIKIRVRPLPLRGQPQAFKGGVGNFSMTARLSDDEVKVGESVTLTLALSGEGNIRDLSDPSIDIEGVKTYSDTPSINVKNYNNNIVGEKIYKVALVPQHAGEIDIPAASIPYFNPQTDRYEVASSGPLKLKAAPAEKETLVITKSSDRDGRRLSAKRDILPIHERIGPIERNIAELWLSRLRPAAYSLPLLVYALCLVIVKRRERLRNDIAYRRHRFAVKTAEKYIAEANEAVKARKWDEVFTKCSRAVTEYLADKLNVPGGGLTPADVRSTLSERGVPGTLLKEIIDFLEGCDYGRFASPRKAPELASRCVKRTEQIIERLEHEESLKR